MLRNFGEALKKSINTMIPVKVISFNAADQTVNIQPDIKVMMADEDSFQVQYDMLGNKVGITHVEMPIIQNVPICHPRAGQFMLNLPIQPGDTGMYIVSQMDITNWKQQGGPAEQANMTIFDINDGFYLPFVPNGSNKATAYDPAKLQILAGPDGTQDIIEMDGVGNVNIITQVNLNITTQTQVTINTKDVTVNTETAEVNATVSALVKSPSVDLGDVGGPPVARVGDSVSPSTFQIISGSAIVRAL